ncbi:MAG TPA: hypothetical protein ENO08_00080 [Candidatus Eisenbacteria bacterium]|uniref:Uncharacterized protein n=1 Tax=Eiseniibacteriota bacterium TaxID=2212470 RepID=A0A7V2F2I3_UNCEI|nr:hypothetical protein [Candidatus Eisenbacteria bacterium]
MMLPEIASAEIGMSRLDERTGAFRLGQNAPKPFNPSATIYYDVPGGGGTVILRICDISGMIMRILLDCLEPFIARINPQNSLATATTTLFLCFF